MLRIFQPTSGGKAGKGHNRTSALQVRNEQNCIVKQVRYTVGDEQSRLVAITKCEAYITNKNKAFND